MFAIRVPLLRTCAPKLGRRLNKNLRGVPIDFGDVDIAVRHDVKSLKDALAKVAGLGVVLHNPANRWTRLPAERQVRRFAGDIVQRRYAVRSWWHIYLSLREDGASPRKIGGGMVFERECSPRGDSRASLHTSEPRNGDMAGVHRAATQK